MKQRSSRLVGLVLGMYGLTFLAAVPYFNWQYAREHTFTSWLMFGGLKATVKAAVWPYYAVVQSRAPSWSAEEIANSRHFFASMEASRAATRLLKSSVNSSVPQATVDEFLRLQRLALYEAALVRNDVLEKAMPGLAVVWREKYERSLKLSLRAVEQREVRGQLAASRLHDEWVDWINSNKNNIRVPRQ